VPQLVFQALKTLKQPPRRIAFVTNTGGSTNFVSYGAPNSNEGGAIAQARRAGLRVVLDLKYPPDVSDWGAIAAQVRSARPDIVWNSGLALDPVNLIQAMQQLNYRPPQLFTLFPAPGPLLAMGAPANGVLSLSLFEPNGPVLKRMGARAKSIVTRFGVEAGKARLSYRVFDSQAAASWSAWEALVAGVRGANSLDHDEICDYLLENGAQTTFVGKLTFDQRAHNFGPAHMAVKQIQNGRWVVVWPPNLRAKQLLPPSGG
jgi:branched-chain amino acid transport system substrate-binding protein